MINLNVNDVKLECTAVNKTQYPIDRKPEVAFVGRSNVGKSALINYLVNRKALARISSTPGKTRGINFYNVENKLYFVDLPGYGYAKVSQKEKESWVKMINQYLTERESLRILILLIDIRHLPTELDKTMLDWIRGNQLNLIVVATKADKLAKSDIQKHLEQVRNTLGLTVQEYILPVSAEKRFGREELWELIQDKL